MKIETRVNVYAYEGDYQIKVADRVRLIDVIGHHDVEQCIKAKHYLDIDRKSVV